MGDPALRVQWFAQTLQIAFVAGLTGRYVDFRSAQRAALTMLADATGTPLDPDNGERIIGEMRRLPPHNAPAGLGLLRHSDLRLVALTNSPLDVARDQLAHAALADRLDAICPPIRLRALKPRPQPYQLVARSFTTTPDGVRRVAAHACDIRGALAAGCAAAFVRRPGESPEPAGRPARPQGRRSR